MALFLFVPLIAVGLGIVGVVVKGLIHLLIIGIVVFLADLVVVGYLRPAPAPAAADGRHGERTIRGRLHTGAVRRPGERMRGSGGRWPTARPLHDDRARGRRGVDRTPIHSGHNERQEVGRVPG